MRSFLISISLVFMIMMVISCDDLSDLLTTNHFEQFEDIDPFSILIGDDTTSFYDDFSEEEQSELIDEYTAAALSIENASELYETLSGNESYKNEVTTYLKDYLEDPAPLLSSPTYSEDIVTYQNRAAALAKIEVYTTDAIAINGLDQMFVDYTSGELEGDLTQEVLLESVFGIDPDNPLIGDDATAKQLEIITDIEALVRAGEAFSYLGESILDKNNPTTTALTSDDGMLILMTCMMNSIIEYSTGSSESDIIANLAYGIVVNTSSFSSYGISFPQDITDSAITAMERYLGEGGALAYSASGLELPSISLFGGNDE